MFDDRLIAYSILSDFFYLKDSDDAVDSMPPARGRGRGRGQRAVPGSTRGGRGGALRQGLTSLSPVGSRGSLNEEIRVGPPDFGSTSGEARGRGGTITPTTATIESAVAIPSSVEAMGVKRPAYGARGIPTNVFVNCFRVDIPTCLIYHYNIFLHKNKRLPYKTTMEVIRRMQEQNPTIFTTRGSYDGRKDLYSPIKYSFGDEAQFEIWDPKRSTPWRVSIEWVDIINPWYAARYVESRTSHDESVLGTLNACNAAIRMQTIQKNPFNTRLFFTRAEFKDMGRGVELWRGYFQSVRPTIGMMVVNVDVSSAAFYKSGPLIKLCLEYMGRSPEVDPMNFLSANRIEPRARRDLLRFIRGLSVRTTGNGQSRIRSIKDISEKGADSLFFNLEGTLVSLAAFFFQTTGRRLRYPTLVCVQLSKTGWIPLECCEVAPGQFYRKTLTPDQTKHMGDFSTLKPQERLRKIRNGFQELGYGNSPYLQDLGMNVDPNPISIQGRILPTPTLMYGNNFTIQPHDGQWNMRGKTLYKPEKIIGYVVIIYDRRFGFDQEQHLKRSLFNTARKLGIHGMPPDPPVLRKDPTGRDFWKHLQEAATLHKAVKGNMPNLVIAVVPDFGEEISYRITNAGDIKLGVATQCLKAYKCGKGNVHYYANVCLKINAKIGGINVIPKPGTVPLLGNRATRTLVIGADVQHPAPGMMSRPSYTAVVGSVDSNASKYVAISRAQLGQTELIDDLADMVAHVIKKYMQYRREVENNAGLAPQRILFYRKGISEDQFKACKDYEVDQIFKACDRIGIPRPNLTFVVVDRRHHIRFFPPPGSKCDMSGNAPAGLVVDRVITSPVEYDFYLQSHAGVQGTNRPAHYSVLADQNNLTPDDLQSISFALCHVYARSTCSVSIVAPVFYAKVVCERAKLHYDPDGGYSYYNFVGAESQILTGSDMENRDVYRRAFQSVHAHIGQHMYFQ